MEDFSKIGSFALLGDADPVPQSLFQSHPEQANTLALLYEVSREVTSILDREELLRRVAERVRKIVNYDVFSVMLWNERTQLLESAFAMCATDSIAARLRLPLHQGLTGTAAGERRVLRINDVTEDPRYIRFETGVEARSELVVPLLMQDRLIGVLDLESTAPHAFTLEHERMLSTLGSYVAIALENARLFEEAKENERRMRGELDTAPTPSYGRARSAGPRFGSRVCSRTRVGRRLLRFSALRTGPPGIHARRCFRQGDRGGAIWFPGDRHRSRNRRRSRMRAGLHARPSESAVARRTA